MAVTNTQAETREATKEEYQRPWLDIVKRFLRHRLAMGSFIMMLLIIMSVLIGPMLSPFTQRDQSLKQKNLPPMSTYVIENNITNADGSVRTPKGESLTVYTGTDELGRDLLTRLLYAGRVSLYIAFAVTLLSELIGIIIGVISGYFGKGIDAFIMRFVDFLNTLPLLPILLLITTIVKPTINILIAILVFFSWTGGARLMRGQILSLREQEYVAASRALGASNLRIMFRHLVPNALAPNIVNASLALSGVMITEAALSFLGFGVQLPAASWGNMLRDAGTGSVLENQPWRAIFPGLAIFICSLCFNFIGDGLRDALDPRAKR
jgi:peptide/nickel transport system permease protein